MSSRSKHAFYFCKHNTTSFRYRWPTLSVRPSVCVWLPQKVSAALNPPLSLHKHNSPASAGRHLCTSSEWLEDKIDWRKSGSNCQPKSDFSPSTLKPGGSFVVRTVTNRKRSDVCRMDWNHRGFKWHLNRCVSVWNSSKHTVLLDSWFCHSMQHRSQCATHWQQVLLSIAMLWRQPTRHFPPMLLLQQPVRWLNAVVWTEPLLAFYNESDWNHIHMQPELTWQHSTGNLMRSPELVTTGGQWNEKNSLWSTLKY